MTPEMSEYADALRCRVVASSIGTIGRTGIPLKRPPAPLSVHHFVFPPRF
jgi:hypothetical protein